MHLAIDPNPNLRTMPATMKRERNNTYSRWLSGKLLKSEFSAVQDSLACDIDSGVKPRILAIFENFAGWEAGAEWGDLEFLFWHSHEVAKIALVAESSWEKKALAFA